MGPQKVLRVTCKSYKMQIRSDVLPVLPGGATSCLAKTTTALAFGRVLNLSIARSKSSSVASALAICARN